jgi:hypothetical protein
MWDRYNDLGKEIIKIREKMINSSPNNRRELIFEEKKLCEERAKIWKENEGWNEKSIC